MGSKAFEAEAIIPALEKIIEGVKPKRAEAGETIEVRVGIKGYDPARDKRFRGEVTLPFSKRKEEKILVLADIHLANALEGSDIPFISYDEYKGKTPEGKKRRKKLIKQYHSFISVPSLYKVFEPLLFTGKKKPVYMIKNINEIKNYYEDVKRKVQLNLKADLLIGFPVGTTKMDSNEVSQNISTAMIALIGLLKKGVQNIRSVDIKSTQGKPIRYFPF
ncbi:large subunit ribosomal protein L10Ae [Nematocida minor]|uniref:large subunit ribosomal protein L10Ae n=1 Tax=Nematocida minor TaxID=1912983 RepID=UPI002220FED6|nr:large subunit ribosomal protein L10Ae [Nematocida minor]KAI5190073.1 large subunit ribosomal protein L10Ae [Nematocida minor]